MMFNILTAAYFLVKNTTGSFVCCEKATIHEQTASGGGNVYAHDLVEDQLNGSELKKKN